MAFDVNFSHRAAKELKKLDRQIQKRIIEKLSEYAAAENLAESKLLTNSELGERRYRIGGLPSNI